MYAVLRLGPVALARSCSPISPIRRLSNTSSHLIPLDPHTPTLTPTLSPILNAFLASLRYLPTPPQCITIAQNIDAAAGTDDTVCMKAVAEANRLEKLTSFAEVRSNDGGRLRKARRKQPVNAKRHH